MFCVSKLSILIFSWNTFGAIAYQYHFRGLLLPKVIVEEFGGSLSDIGMLGGGIYFADASRYLA